VPCEQATPLEELEEPEDDELEEELEAPDEPEEELEAPDDDELDEPVVMHIPAVQVRPELQVVFP
jgi:hypothetical protein